MDYCSLWTGSGEAVQNITAVISIWTAIYRPARRMSVKKSYERYQNPDTSSHSEIHEEDGRTGPVEFE